MDKKQAMDAERGVTARDKVPLGRVGAKNNVRITLAFEHVLVHFVIASGNPGLSTGRVEDNFTACFAGGRIKLDCP